MKRLSFLFGFLGLLCLATGLSGCITDATPNTNETVKMEMGDVQTFTVYGTTGKNVYYQWWIKRGGVFEFQHRNQGESSSIVFTADPETASNNISVVCWQARKTDTYLGTLVGNTQGVKEWHVEIAQTPPVWQGNYHIAKQDDIDFLEENGYEEITGNVILKSSKIRFFEGLDNIKTIGGDFTVFGSVRELNGLNGLTTIGGNVRIQFNDDLKTITGLDNLNRIDGDLYITGNDHLTSMSSLNNLTSVGGDVRIADNGIMTSLSGLTSLTTVDGKLSMVRNVKLTKINGLNHITTVKEDLDIGGHASLISLDNFKSVTSVDGSLVIVYNDALPNLDGLSNIKTVGQNLLIGTNESLTDLGLSSLSSVGTDFTINENPELCTNLAEELRDQVQTDGGIGGTVKISDNKQCDE